MAKQLSFTDPTPEEGKILPTSLQSEMQRSYLEYAMSVIVGRAIPDVRDGLKPVHRRILFAMAELGLTPDRPFRKCARVVGDVLGKYHPHGDQAVYDALVRMVQEFSSRYPFLSGHGNFGSVDNDPAAAMRYTECRLAAVGFEGLLEDVREEVVDFQDNFDGSQREPVVLPAKLPILLLNGCNGIAVGMATNIPPHNLGELVDGLVALADNQNLSDEALHALIPGPDFPTGGHIVNTDGIRDAYTNGRGSVTVRGVVHQEEVGRGRSRKPALVVTELPYQVNKAAWIEKVADLVNEGRIQGISDLRDESDRTGMRVVIELRKEAQPEAVLQQLFRLTQLQDNFGVILLSIVNGQPRLLSLKQLLQEFLNFREETLSRRLRCELGEKQQKAHLLAGSLIALDNLDGVINLLRTSADVPTARGRLQSEMNLSTSQAEAVLQMPLRRLTQLDRGHLQSEQEELLSRIATIESLLTDRMKLMNFLKAELKTLKKKYDNPRRTQINPHVTKMTVEPIAVAADVTCTVQVTQKGYIRRFRPTKNRRSENANTAISEGVEDYVVEQHSSTTQKDLLVVTRMGRVHQVPISEIPETSRGRGTPLVTLVSASDIKGDEVCTTFALQEYPDDQYMVLRTAGGKLKRMALSEFGNLTGRGLNAIKLGTFTEGTQEKEDYLVSAHLTGASGHAVLATSGGRLLRFPLDEAQLPVMGRQAAGLKALKLRPKEQLVSMTVVAPPDQIVLITARGFGKRLPLSAIRSGSRSDMGTPGLLQTKGDELAGMISVSAREGQQVLVLTSSGGPNRIHNLPVDQIPLEGRETAGKPIVKLLPEERVKGLIMPSTEEETPG